MKSVLPGETCKGMRESKQGKGRTGKGYGFKIESGLCILSWGTLDCKLHPRIRPPFGDPLGFPGGSDGKESACDAGDLSLIPESGRSPGKGNGNPLLEKPMDRGALWATVHGVANSQTWLNDRQTNKQTNKQKEVLNWASLITQLLKNPPAMQETLVWLLGWEDALEKGKATHSSILA